MGLRRLGGQFTGPFRGRRGGTVQVHLDTGELALLADLIEQTAELLDPDTEPDDTEPDDIEANKTEPDDTWDSLVASLSVEPPSDPAVARLLPDGNRDDPELAQSFRRLTEYSLREFKQRTLGTAAAALRRPEPVLLTRDEADALMRSLTDVRLVLAERLGVRTDEDAAELHDRLQAAHQLLDDDPDAPADAPVEAAGVPNPAWVRLAAIYEALTYWQESLIASLH